MLEELSFVNLAAMPHTLHMRVNLILLVSHLCNLSLFSRWNFLKCSVISLCAFIAKKHDCCLSSLDMIYIVCILMTVCLKQGCFSFSAN